MANFQDNQYPQLCVPSPDGRLIAVIEQSHLTVRSSITNEVIQQFSLPRKITSKWQFIRWFAQSCLKTRVMPGMQGAARKFLGARRLLIANNDVVLIWDIDDPQWHATISGVTSHVRKIEEISFGFSGDDVLIFSAFGIKVTIWSLVSGRGVEIKDPKSHTSCLAFRPQTGHLALLTRPATNDVLLLLNPKTHELVESIDLATIDAQGVKWSPDGQWLAIWDAASVAYKVLIYTANGHLFKTYAGGQDAEKIGLGVGSLQWCPSARDLVVGDCNHRVTLLRTTTFSPRATLDHPNTIITPLHSKIWQEQIDAMGERSFVIAASSTCPPTQNLTSEENNGVSILEYSSDGSFFVTKDDFASSTIWIWSLKEASAVAVLIHHAAVKKVQWHPVITDLLLILCTLTEPVIHLWRHTWEIPKVITIHQLTATAGLEAFWLQDDTKELPRLLLSDSKTHVTIQIDHDGKLASRRSRVEAIGEGPEDIFDEGNSLDLSALKESHDEHANNAKSGLFNPGLLSAWASSNEVEDTFQFKRPVRVAT